MSAATTMVGGGCWRDVGALEGVRARAAMRFDGEGSAAAESPIRLLGILTTMMLNVCVYIRCCPPREVAGYIHQVIPVFRVFDAV
jgi:hypothetical protein